MTKEDFEAWKLDSTTKYVFKYFQDYLDELTVKIGKEYLSTSCVGLSSDELVRNQATQHGVNTAIQDIIDLEYQDIENFYYKEEKNEL